MSGSPFAGSAGSIAPRSWTASSTSRTSPPSIRSTSPARLDELRLLKAGWLDGAGNPLNGADVDKLSAAFTAHYPNDLPLPYTFPTAAGGIQFEWRIDGATPEIEIDLASFRGEWLADDDEATIDLANPEGWSDLARRVAPPRTSNSTGELG